MSGLLKTFAVVTLVVSLAPAGQPARAADRNDHDIIKTEARVDRIEQRLDRALAKGHEEVAERIRAHDLDQAKDRLDALRDHDHDHHK